MSGSEQDKLGRVRPEIFHMKYQVKVGNAIEKKELPFLMGIMADLSGHPAKELPSLARREFLDIDRDNFTAIQRGIEPRLDLLVDNHEGKKVKVELKFPTMEQFTPEGVVRQVPALAELLEIRQELAGLVAKIDGKEEVTSRLEKLLHEAEAAEARSGKSEGDK